MSLERFYVQPFFPGSQEKPEVYRGAHADPGGATGRATLQNLTLQVVVEVVPSLGHGAPLSTWRCSAPAIMDSDEHDGVRALASRIVSYHRMCLQPNHDASHLH